MADHHLEALPLVADARAALPHNAGITVGDNDAVVSIKLHRALARPDPVQTTSLDTDAPVYASVGSCLDAAYGVTRANTASTEPSTGPAPPLEHDSQGRIYLDTGPASARRSMVS